MAPLRAARRKKLKKTQFGLPSARKYPIDTKMRAGNAKGRAKQQLKKGQLSRSSYNQIVRRANAALKRFGAKSTTTKKRKKR